MRAWRAPSTTVGLLQNRLRQGSYRNTEPRCRDLLMGGMEIVHAGGMEGWRSCMREGWRDGDRAYLLMRGMEVVHAGLQGAHVRAEERDRLNMG